MIYIDGSTYLAKNCITGANDYTATDVWALFNTIDSNLAINNVYKFAFSVGIFKGSATFSPGAGKGYLFSGAGAATPTDSVSGNNPSGGTLLNYTGTGHAIETNSTAWFQNNGWQVFTTQVLTFRDIGIQASASSKAVLDIKFCNSFKAYNFAVYGNVNTSPGAVTNSVGIGLIGTGQEGHSVIESSFIGGFYKAIYTEIDHLVVSNSEIIRNTNCGICITFGNEIAINNVHFFHSQNDVYDTRTPTNGYTLTMIDLSDEGGVGPYTNVNGGYYFLLTQPGLGCCNQQILSTNYGTGIAILGGQTTLVGTTAGSIIWSMPFQGTGTSYKKFIGFSNGYQNSGGSAQTVSYTTAFVKSPAFTKNDLTGTTTTTTTLTLPTAMGSPITGWIIVEGY